MDDKSIFIVGAAGQLGTALRVQYPNSRYADIDELDITDRTSVEAYDWSGIQTIINAAAYTKVDDAETAEGRKIAWKVNAHAVASLATIANKINATLVHISTDYVFDGTATEHSEQEEYSPLSVYGASKAAADLVVGLVVSHYILRTSWVIGEGKNFVRTMLELGDKGINPSVVNDQIGRLTFTSELVRAIDFLLINKAPYGTYNVTNSGESVSWADIAQKIFTFAQLPNSVTGVSTESYYVGKSGIAPRPLHSSLLLDKIQKTGFVSKDWHDDLEEYIKKERA